MAAWLRSPDRATTHRLTITIDEDRRVFQTRRSKEPDARAKSLEVRERKRRSRGGCGRHLLDVNGDVNSQSAEREHRRCPTSTGPSSSPPVTRALKIPEQVQHTHSCVGNTCSHRHKLDLSWQGRKNCDASTNRSIVAATAALQANYRAADLNSCDGRQRGVAKSRSRGSVRNAVPQRHVEQNRHLHQAKKHDVPFRAKGHAAGTRVGRVLRQEHARNAHER